MELTGQVALVTGASRGLGLALARELLRRGCRVAVCARDPEELERARVELARDGADVLAVPCDVSNRDQVEELVARTVDQFGSLDVLITNAGVIQVGPLPTMRVEDFEDAMGVMFWGVVLPTLAALPHLRETRGRIVTITSIGGKVAAPHLLPYDAAKFAAVGFSEGLAAELAREGVRVTTVVPGLMRTGSPLNAFFKGQEAREFSWFTVADSVPGLSMDAERAARRIVTAMQRGRTEVLLTAPAKLAVRVHGLMPATTVRTLGLVNRLLPRADAADQHAVRGEAAATAIGSPLFHRLIATTRRAAERLRQRPGPVASPAAVRSARSAPGEATGPGDVSSS
ncbi:SDR family oxidoreductase [Blastococcus montanus]|uniref:SDR family NAD(P)-dependent oxidoreductase n=1 Tax=Blastococcus montanus TaxID=3144973 RepID=UPI003208BBE5